MAAAYEVISMKPIVNSYFSGAGLMDLGLELGGSEVQQSFEIDRDVATRLAGTYRDRPIISDPSKGDMAPTCVAHYAKDLSTRLVADARFPGGARPYTVREYARLKGVPDWFQFSGGSRAAYKQIGNGVSVPVGQWLGSELVRYFNRNTRAPQLSFGI